THGHPRRSDRPLPRRAGGRSDGRHLPLPPQGARMTLLSGKTALVTGSSQGIGLGVAKAFVASGARVVLTSERPRDQVPEAGDVPSRPGTHYVKANLTQDGEPERLVAEAWDRLGSIDVLVNNVGTYREPPFLELTKRHFDAIFHLNVWVALALTRE